MAGDWIKMRPTLLTSPKVNGIARALESSRKTSRALTTNFDGVMGEIVTRNVMRNVTVASLMIVWGAANEHTSDGIFRNADLTDIDDMVGIPGFGEAMASVGWAEYDPDEDCVILPNFNEYNTCGRARSKESNAERQRRYRQKQKENRNGSRNVTEDVTSNGREEKRREEDKYTPTPASKDERAYVTKRKRTLSGKQLEWFEQFWEAFGYKQGKAEAADAWLDLRLTETDVEPVVTAAKREAARRPELERAGRTPKMAQGWLSGRRWEDDPPPTASDETSYGVGAI